MQKGNAYTISPADGKPEVIKWMNNIKLDLKEIRCYLIYVIHSSLNDASLNSITILPCQ
jgi:hypothetical protein